MRVSGLFTLMTLGVLLLTACSPSSALPPTPQPTITPLPTTTPVPLPTAGPDDNPQIARDVFGTGQIRIVQAAAHASAVDVYLDDRLLGARMGPEAFTDPINVQQGDYVVQVVPAQARPNTQVLAELSITIESDRSYILVISGPPDGLIIAQYPLDTAPIPIGQSRIMYLHGVPRAPDTVAVLDDRSFSDTFAYGEIFTADPVEAGLHTLAFKTTDNTAAELTQSLEEQVVYTAMLLGDVSGGNEHILMLSQRLEAAGKVRIIHAAPDAMPAQLLVDGEPLSSANLAYRAATDWLMLNPGRHTLTVNLGSENQALEEINFTLNPGQSTEFALLAGEDTLEVLAYTLDSAPTPRHTAKIVVINAVEGTSFVQGFDYGDLIPQISLQSFGTANRPSALEARSYGLVWYNTVDTQQTPIEEPGVLTLEEGYSYTYVVTGENGNPLLIGTYVGVDDTLPSLYTTARDTPTEQGQSIEVRVINALVPSQPIDVRLGTIATVVEPYTFSQRETYTVGRHYLGINTNTGGITPRITDAITLPDEEAVILLVFGTAQNVAYMLLEDYAQPIQSGQSIVRFINANPAEKNLYATIDLHGYTAHLTPQPTDEHNPLLTPIFAPNQPQYQQSQYQSQVFAAGAASAFIGLPKGSFTMQAIDSLDDTVVAIMPRIELQSQTCYTFLLLPDEHGTAYTVEVLTP